jgi:ribosome biogenesis GTPase / thiamine phosphate phosphatase
LAKLKTAPAAAVAGAAATVSATIVQSFGRHYTAALADRTEIHARPRGKRSECAVGDAVQLTLTGKDEGVIERIEPRRNVLMRAEEHRSKEFAANVDALAYVVAAEPPVHDDLLVRATTAALAAGIEPWLVLNKADLAAPFAALVARMNDHAPVLAKQFCVSTRTGDGMAALRDALAGRRVVFAGQSGMGKSTLLNALVPGAKQAIGELSVALSAGRHTTTAARLFRMEGGGELIDSPGFQAFGLAHLTRTELERGFPEFEQFATGCRFYNCRHLDEPGCAVRGAVEGGLLPKVRYDLFARLMRNTSA